MTSEEFLSVYKGRKIRKKVWPKGSYFILTEIDGTYTDLMCGFTADSVGNVYSDWWSYVNSDKWELVVDIEKELENV